MDPKTEARIRDRAYQLWLENGGQHGKANDYWYKAEQEILSEQALQDATASAREEGPDRSPELLSATPDGTTGGGNSLRGGGRCCPPSRLMPPATITAAPMTATTVAPARAARAFFRGDIASASGPGCRTGLTPRRPPGALESSRSRGMIIPLS